MLTNEAKQSRNKMKRLEKKDATKTAEINTLKHATNKTIRKSWESIRKS